MTFASPHLLWLLLVPALLLPWEFRRRRVIAARTHPKIVRAEAGLHALRLLASSAAPASSGARVRPWLWLAVAFAIVALARPQWGRIDEPVFDQSREILIAIDLSRSMLAPDIKPSRLERSKLLTQSLLERLEGERVGLIVFAGTAFLQSPLSADYEILRDFLPALSPDYLPQGGSNYRALLDAALQAFGATSSADRFLIVLSDGDATDNDWRSRIATLKERGVRVIGLGVGTDAGTMIPDGSGGFVKDPRGAVVLSKLESATLRTLAEETSGTYRDASNWVDLAGLVAETVETGRKGEFVEKNSVRLVERYQWPLAFALWCFLVSLFYEFPVRPRSRDLRLSRPESKSVPSRATTGTVSALILAGVIAMFGSDQLVAADDTGPLLGKIYARLAAKDQLSPLDYSEIAQETLRWGTRLKDAGQPVIPGPVYDALEAVDHLEKANARTANWDKLRADLRALLEKDEQQEQQQQQQDQQKQDQQQKQEQQNQQQDSSSQQKDQSQPQTDPSSPQNSEDQKQDQSEDGSEKESPPSESEEENQQPPPPQPPEETQQVGGEKNPRQGQPPTDPALALPLQKLDQLREKDSPAQLFQLLDAEKADKNGAPAKPGKDW